MTILPVESVAKTVFASAEFVLYSAQEEALDEALAETFPFSDPIAVSITRHEYSIRRVD